MKTENKNRDHLSTILDSIADGVFTVDKNWLITSFNRAAEKITGVKREEAIAQPCCEVFRTSICETNCALRQTTQTGKPIIDRAIYIIDNDGKRIPVSISTALLKDENGKVIGGVETFRDLSIVEELRKELERQYSFEDIISKSPAMQQIFETLPLIAQSDSTVLIEGESGTGKELLARAIHNLSHRSTEPLVTVNCGALPDTLLESELFGYKTGAFTDAKQDKPGRFALAEGGTIFLDEIGDLSPATQVKLLRVLQDGYYEPLGTVEPKKANVRIITATNRHLSMLVEKKEFRLDLYYRINIVQIEMPPLRERREDIPLLIDHFINKFNKLRNKLITGVSPDVLSILMQHSFLGNVRELENIIEHAFVLCNEGHIGIEHLPTEIRHHAQLSQPVSASKTLSNLESEFILASLKRNRWNRLETAKELGIHKSTLFRKIKKLGIVLPREDGRYKTK
ncbi:MAG: sigma 54-interacting transcriptional regulator [Candidatus Hatepunaea meridiana]|nr:sigma 54-interacting transcriptional regulator [Candidatus Hatepunaea meridiana]